MNTLKRFLFKIQALAKVFPFVVCLITSLILSSSALASLPLPQQLDRGEMRKVLQVLGPATSTASLSSPYPLGGWEGFELGLSKHYIPFSYLSKVDENVGKQKDYDYPIITIGKGLFYDIDLFLSIIPINKSESLNYYSTQVRYRFWRSLNNVFHLSGLVYASTSTLNNQLNMQNNGFDLIGSIILDKVSIFIGFGRLHSTGRFIGGASGLTETQNTESEVMNISHQLIGIEWPVGSFFVSAEADRYSIPYYSIKLGYRR